MNNLRTKWKPSPAMVIAVLALSVAVVGTAFAGPIAQISLTKNEKKQTKKIARGIANKLISKRAPKLAVASALSANSAKAADSATTAASAANAANADQLGGAPAAAYAKASPEASKLATLEGGWVQEPGRGPARFYKDAFGIVHLEGIVEGGGTFSSIFTLPPGYRPEDDANFLVYGNASTPAGLYVDSADGEVALLEGDDAFVSLFGVTFRAGN